MKALWGHLPLIALLIALAVGGYWCFRPSEAERKTKTSEVLRSKRIVSAAGRRGSDRSATKIGGDRDRVRTALKAAARSDSARHAKNKPDFDFDEEEEKKLSVEYRRMLTDLRSALDADNKKAVFRYIQDMLDKINRGKDVPKIIKEAAIESLGWYGADGIPEIAGLLADADPEIARDALDKFEEMLFDADGDVATAEVICQVAKVITDSDTLDTFVFEMDSMRPTVKAQTALSIFESGSEAAVKVLKENLNDLFADADLEVNTEEDVLKYYEDSEAYYQENPSKAVDDEKFYGPQFMD